MSAEVEIEFSNISCGIDRMRLYEKPTIKKLKTELARWNVWEKPAFIYTSCPTKDTKTLKKLKSVGFKVKSRNDGHAFLIKSRGKR